jgi:hypothetical protein
LFVNKNDVCLSERSTGQKTFVTGKACKKNNKKYPQDLNALNPKCFGWNKGHNKGTNRRLAQMKNC